MRRFYTYSVVSLVCLGLVTVSAALAEPVQIGSLLFASNLTTDQGFEVTNSTGPADGCDAADSIPICTILNFVNTSLTVTLDDGSTITRTPSNHFAFTPGSYIYGDNPGDDLSNSFLFDTSLNIVSATFSGQIDPTSFQITDSDSNGNLSTFFSDGTFSLTLDLSSLPPLAGDVLTVSEASSPGPEVPEPGSAALLLCSLAACGAMRKLYSAFRRTAA